MQCRVMDEVLSTDGVVITKPDCGGIVRFVFHTALHLRNPSSWAAKAREQGSRGFSSGPQEIHIREVPQTMECHHCARIDENPFG